MKMRLLDNLKNIYKFFFFSIRAVLSIINIPESDFRERRVR